MPVNNIFSGKHISIIGDSISTLKGYLPSYCKAFYMQNPYADCSGSENGSGTDPSAGTERIFLYHDQ